MQTDSFTQVLQEWNEVFMHRSFRDMKQFMDEAGLSPSQAMTLMRLHHCRVSDVSEIAEQVGVSNAAASQLIERLVQMGLVTRSELQSDRRVKQVELTNEGQALVQRSFKARQEWLHTLIDTLGESQTRTITSALKTMTKAARKLDAEMLEPQNTLRGMELD